MSKLTLEQAKHLVAEKKGFESWEDMLSIFRMRVRVDKSNEFERSMDELERAYDQISELIAQNWSNEAVKEDRQIISGLYAPAISEFKEIVIRHHISKLPLPYPEIDKP